MWSAFPLAVDPARASWTATPRVALQRVEPPPARRTAALRAAATLELTRPGPSPPPSPTRGCCGSQTRAPIAPRHIAPQRAGPRLSEPQRRWNSRGQARDRRHPRPEVAAGHRPAVRLRCDTSRPASAPDRGSPSRSDLGTPAAKPEPVAIPDRRLLRVRDPRSVCGPRPSPSPLPSPTGGCCGSETRGPFALRHIAPQRAGPRLSEPLRPWNSRGQARARRHPRPEVAAGHRPAVRLLPAAKPETAAIPDRRLLRVRDPRSVCAATHPSPARRTAALRAAETLELPRPGPSPPPSPTGGCCGSQTRGPFAARGQARARRHP